MELNMKITAKIRSLNTFDTVTVKEKIGNNQFLVNYRGTGCIAMFNPFEGVYYVDDIYGILPPVPEDEWDKAVQEMKYLYESNERELEAYRKIGSVSYLKALKKKEAKKLAYADKASKAMQNIFVGSFGAFCVWSLIYIIATAI